MPQIFQQTFRLGYLRFSSRPNFKCFMVMSKQSTKVALKLEGVRVTLELKDAPPASIRISLVYTRHCGAQTQPEPWPRHLDHLPCFFLLSHRGALITSFSVFILVTSFCPL